MTSLAFRDQRSRRMVPLPSLCGTDSQADSPFLAPVADVTLTKVLDVSPPARPPVSATDVVAGRAGPSHKKRQGDGAAYDKRDLQQFDKQHQRS